MAKSKPMTSDEYVTAKLVETEGKLEEANLHIRTLEEDLDAFHTDMMHIRKVFKIELSTSNKEYKIACYKDPENTWNTEILAWSGSLNKDEFKPEFVYLKKILHLELPDEEEDLELEDLEDLEDPDEVK